MWISKKKWQALEKRVADLEVQVQGQLDVKIDADSIRRALQRIEQKHPKIRFNEARRPESEFIVKEVTYPTGHKEYYKTHYTHFL